MGIIGETLAAITSALWITGWEWVKYIFLVSACVFAFARFMENTDKNDITIRRLYKERKIGAAFLLLAAVVMVAAPFYFFGYYILKSTWILPFVIFAIFEVYTTFRISYLEK